jgi:hypothetical protein
LFAPFLESAAQHTNDSASPFFPEDWATFDLDEFLASSSPVPPDGEEDAGDEPPSEPASDT